MKRIASELEKQLASELEPIRAEVQIPSRNRATGATHVILTVREVSQDVFEKYGQMKDRAAARALLIHSCVVDEDGNPALSESFAADLANSVPRVSAKIIGKIMEISGFGADEKKD